MASYRFCRPDDMRLLVKAVSDCFLPHFPESPSYSIDEFKREVREDNLWSSSCMVALGEDSNDPIAVLIGYKRSHGTLIGRIAARPDSLRNGHCRHLLRSISGKLAVLGPPTLLAELPEKMPAVTSLFESAGYKRIGPIYDLVRSKDYFKTKGNPLVETAPAAQLIEEGIFEGPILRSWCRQKESLLNRIDLLSGLAILSGSGIEGALLYRTTKDYIDLPALYLPTNKHSPRILEALISAIPREAQNLSITGVSETDHPLQILCDSGFETIGKKWLYQREAEAI